MTASNREDHYLKTALLDDTFTIIDMEGVYLYVLSFQFQGLKAMRNKLEAMTSFIKECQLVFHRTHCLQLFLGAIMIEEIR